MENRNVPNFVRWLNENRLRLRKVALFVWLYTIVLTCPYLLIIYAWDWMARLFGNLWWVVPAGLLFVLASAAPMIYLAFLRRLEAKILRDQRRYHRTLIVASSGMTRIKDVQRLCRLIVYVVNRTVRLTHSGLFLYQPEEKRYVLKAVRYKATLPHNLSVEEAAPLVERLRQTKDLLLVDELGQEKEIHEWMRRLEIRLIVPSFSSDRLLGFLALGGKRTAEPYTTDDIAMFSGLANQAALAIENAMVFEELRANEAYMIQSEKLASLGQLASGMAHEIHNPLTIISGEAQLYLERFKGQNDKVDAVLKSIIEECQRAADITRRILRFAKPAPIVGRLAELLPVDLKVVLEESLTLARYQVRMDRVECVVTIPSELPKVRGNQNQLQEVLLNLILNACQAMGEKGGRLMLSASSTNGTSVAITVADTGPGIPSNKLGKIFDPFFTTKQSGTGLGLFVSQRIVQSHGGVLEVDSAEGRGTSFTIRLPVWLEVPAPATH
jgi:signal transduction histidine kinase